ncbi:hypothetical protein LTR43_012573 [Exophiala xenobiotica]|nr:hypothetical protein LTR43_012573 [Exophiala xenobiotica]
MPGLLNFVDNEFSGVQKPITVIVTPKDRQNPVPGVLMYESMVETINTGILMIFPKGTPTDYTPKHDSHSQIWLAYVDQQLMTIGGTPSKMRHVAHPVVIWLRLVVWLPLPNRRRPVSLHSNLRPDKSRLRRLGYLPQLEL